jgi:SAM-dependent methyltransferase|eukprot:CAMPEP_0174298532 /NCGR_PEP_ID=MMETSP0809-20121228/54032_1 /TAXON_ID=73025 ORGANISM="Eutreptiella gymnastica-like, Strain CCMP1594" /NCGR_SAMPLE_ID=MMETSP0809 /ASSEMBLY_ACC=CAM_ASM_000658 /LENGTH=239 /DNA_ID=CAMNT_0015403025 /DNA_START=21 /DNA_END=740 /DNA_ORIENTATION=+
MTHPSSPRKAPDVERDQKDYWSLNAPTCAFSTPFHMDAFCQQVPFEKKVLDYGCGYGRTLMELSKAGFTDLHGVDFCPEMIDRAKMQQIPRVELMVKKGRRTTYDIASFDAIILLNTLSCIMPNSEQLRLIDEVKKLLKPNGKVYVNDFLVNEEDENSLAKYNEHKEAYQNEDFDYDYGIFVMGDGGLCRHHDPDWIKQLFVDFTPDKYEEYSMADGAGNVTKAFYFIGTLPAVGALPA